MTVSLSSMDDSTGVLSFDLELLDTQLTADSVPTLRIRVKNTGDEAATWSYGGGRSSLPFPQGVQSDANEVVIGLADTVRGQLMDSSDGCARVPYFVRDDAIKKTALDPAETVERRYAVAGVDENLEGVCPEPGSYRLEADFEQYGSWGFEIQFR